MSSKLARNARCQQNNDLDGVHAMSTAKSLVIVLAVGGGAIAAESSGPAERAAPPEWTRDVLDAFFDDARDALEGERPVAATAPTDAAPSVAVGANGDGFAWSQVISAETLAGEVTRVANDLKAPLANPTVFASEGHQQCQAAFGLLAVLWAVIDEYDGEVRWQDSAAALRDAAARTSRNCETASEESFADANERRLELEDLVRGGRVDTRPVDPVENWSDLAERNLLMRRMELGYQEWISPQLSDARTFARAAVDLQHEAEMLAALAEVIHREEYEFWDDETFVGYASELGAAATDLARAAAEDDYEAARAAAGRAGQACVACHDGYRG
jgi:hypothetical protein